MILSQLGLCSYVPSCSPCCSARVREAALAPVLPSLQGEVLCSQFQLDNHSCDSRQTAQKCHQTWAIYIPELWIPSKKQHLTEESCSFLNCPLINVCFWGWSFSGKSIRIWISAVNPQSGTFPKASKPQAHHFWRQLCASPYTVTRAPNIKH